jgi:MoaA/NifB/PqqE/SkfB family radical SAM enzyme
LKPYRTVYFDIVGFCNARCPYCLTGGSKEKSGGVIAPEVFENTLTKLLSTGVIDFQSVISLYNWGEPFLHPRLHEIIGIINKLGIKYAISTNAAKIPVVTVEFVRNLDHVIFSMCGFSQESYHRIHGFDFEKIKNNIIKLVDDCRSHGFRGDFFISYHVYRFNTGEIKACEDFASEHGIVIRPYYAILNHWWELLKFVNGELPQDRVKEISGDLFGLDEIAETMRKSPASYQCPQHHYLIITENADVLVCCQLPKHGADFSCGNIISEGIDDVLKKKEKMRVCESCIRTGLAYYLNTSLAVPTFYKRSLFQHFLLLKSKIRRLIRS